MTRTLPLLGSISTTRQNSYYGSHGYPKSERLRTASNSSGSSVWTAASSSSERTIVSPSSPKGIDDIFNELLRFSENIDGRKRHIIDLANNFLENADSKTPKSNDVENELGLENYENIKKYIKDIFVREKANIDFYSKCKTTSQAIEDSEVKNIIEEYPFDCVIDEDNIKELKKILSIALIDIMFLEETIGRINEEIEVHQRHFSKNFPNKPARNAFTPILESFYTYFMAINTSATLAFFVLPKIVGIAIFTLGTAIVLAKLWHSYKFYIYNEKKEKSEKILNEFSNLKNNIEEDFKCISDYNKIIVELHTKVENLPVHASHITSSEQKNPYYQRITPSVSWEAQNEFFSLG